MRLCNMADVSPPPQTSVGGPAPHLPLVLPFSSQLLLPHSRPAPAHPPPAPPQIVNHFGMRSDIQSYSLGGMGCATGVLGISLLSDLLKVRGCASSLLPYNPPFLAPSREVRHLPHRTPLPPLCTASAGRWGLLPAGFALCVCVKPQPVLAATF